MHTIKHINFELEEAMHIHSQAIDWGEDSYSTDYLKVVLPFIAAVEANSFVVVVTPILTGDF